MHLVNDEWLTGRYREILHIPDGCKTFGFECLSGWTWLLDGTLQLIISQAKGHDPEFEILQVKEKFGGLRIAYRGGNDSISAICDIAEISSVYVCEVCGQPGTNELLQGWQTTRCHRHKENTESLISPANRDSYLGFGFAYCTSQIITFFGDAKTAVKWCDTPLFVLNRAKPCAYLNSIEGREKIREIIGKLSYGVPL